MYRSSAELRSLRLAVGAALLCIGLTGCMTQNVQLDREHIERGNRVATQGQTCTLPKFELIDVRDYQGLGWIGRHELLYPDLQQWLDEHLRRAAQTDVSHAGPPLLIELNRAYMEAHPSGHSFQLVLRARAAADPGADRGTELQPAALSDWRVYRGNVSAITWFGNDAEFGSYVRQAGFAAIKALIVGEGSCSGRERRRR